MSRNFTTVVATTVILAAAVGIALQLTGPYVTYGPEPIVSSSFQGKLPIPQTEFLPIFDQATTEIENRKRWSRQLRIVKNVLVCIGLVATALGSIYAAFFKKPPELSGENPDGTKLLRYVAVLIALGSVLTQVSGELASQSEHSADSAKALSDILLDANETLFDSESTAPKARIVLDALKKEIG